MIYAMIYTTTARRPAMPSTKGRSCCNAHRVWHSARMWGWVAPGLASQAEQGANPILQHPGLHATNTDQTWARFIADPKTGV